MPSRPGARQGLQGLFAGGVGGLALTPRIRKSSSSESGPFALDDLSFVCISSSIPWGRSFSTCVCVCLAPGAFLVRSYMGWVVWGRACV